MRSLFLPNSWVELCVCCVCITHMRSCSHVVVLTGVCVCVVCVGARACSLSRSPPRAGVISQNWIQLYVLNPTFSTPEVMLCTRTHFTHTITHSLMHTTLAILSHITCTYHVKFMLTVWLEIIFRPHSWIMKQWFTLDICTRYVQQDEDSNIFVFCMLSEWVKCQAYFERLLTWSFVFLKQKVSKGEDVFSILKKFGMSKK